MKTTTRSNIYLPMAAMILTAALAVPAAAQQQVPFKGTFQGSDTVTPPATIATAATGTGTHLGQFSFTHVLTVNHSHRVCSLGGGQWGQHRFDIRRIGGTGTRCVYRHGNSHHYWWDGSILGRPGELYRALLHALEPSAVAGGDRNARHLRLVPGDDYFPGRSSLRRVNTRAAWQVSRIGTGHLVDQPNGRFRLKEGI